MSDGGDLRIDKESLERITKGLRRAIGELKESGSSATSSLQGSGFGGLSLSHREAGHSGLAQDFEGFCERWEWGVRALVQDANQIAARLGLAAGMVWSEDQYREGTFKVTANALVGNPHLSEAEVTGKDWDELFNAEVYKPDYSGESFEKAWDESAQTWKDTGRSVVTEGQVGEWIDRANESTGVDDETFDRAVDDAFGPSPEERARNQQQGDGG